jgi:FG-GAP repeat
MERSNSPAPHRALARFAVLALLASPLALAQEREAAVLLPPLPSAGQFGRGLAFAEPWAFVGDIVSSTVSFYRREADGWKLRWMDRGAAGSYFGRALATDGATLVAGIHTKGWPQNVRGAVRIYELIDHRWVVTQEIDAPGFLDMGTLFGWSVAVEGDLMVIGAPGHKKPFHFSGLILIYERAQGVWTLSTTFGQEIIDGPNGWHGSLGSGGLEIVGDAIAVAAPGFAGGVYILDRDGQGWKRTALISEPNPPDEGQTFGRALALSEDGQVLVVGQPKPDSKTYPFVDAPGRAHVFERGQAGGWVRTAVLRASDEHFDSEGGTQFGQSIGIEGSCIVIGASLAKGDPAMPGARGAIYVFERGSDGAWPETETLRWWGSNPEYIAGLGTPLALDRGFVLAGSKGHPVHIFELTTGTSFCPVARNSTGKEGRLSAVGSPFLNKNSLTLSARDCPRESPGYFLAASDRAAPVFLDSLLLCLAPPISRVGGLATTGKTGAAYRDLDLADPRFAGALGPGTTAYFQYWFFDPVSGKSNLTNAVAVTFE